MVSIDQETPGTVMLHQPFWIRKSSNFESASLTTLRLDCGTFRLLAPDALSHSSGVCDKRARQDCAVIETLWHALNALALWDKEHPTRIPIVTFGRAWSAPISLDETLESRAEPDSGEMSGGTAKYTRFDLESSYRQRSGCQSFHGMRLSSVTGSWWMAEKASGHVLEFRSFVMAPQVYNFGCSSSEFEGIFLRGNTEQRSSGSNRNKSISAPLDLHTDKQHDSHRASSLELEAGVVLNRDGSGEDSGDEWVSDAQAIHSDPKKFSGDDDTSNPPKTIYWLRDLLVFLLVASLSAAVITSWDVASTHLRDEIVESREVSSVLVQARIS